MKKALFLLIVFLLMASAAGCTPMEAGAQATEPDWPEGMEPALQADKPIKIVWYWKNGDIQVPLNGYITRKIKEDLNIEYVHVKPSSTDYEERLNLMLAAGDQLDIVGATGSLKSMLIDSGALIPIDRYLNERYIPNVIRISKDWQRALEQTVMPDGKRYTVPKCTAKELCTSCFIRYDWLRSLGLGVPTTYDELEDVLIRFSRDDPDRNGKDDTWGTVFNEIYGASYLALNMGCSYGCYYQNDGKLTYWIFHPRVKEWVRLIRRLVEEGAASPDILTTKFPQVEEMVKAGAVGFLWSFNELEYNDDIRGLQPACDWDIMPPPRGIYAEGYIDANPLVINEYGVTSSCQNVEACFRLMNYFSDDRSTADRYDFSGTYFDMKLGERGVNWTVANGAIDDGVIDKKIAERNKTDTWVGLAGTFSSQFDTSYILNYPSYRIELFKKQSSYKKIFDIPADDPAAPVDCSYVAQGFPDASKFLSDFDARFNDYFDKAVLGKVDVDEGYEAFIGEARQAGLDEYTDEIDRAYRSR
jgi:ABC-type glycerol-3-phosphate transport system substrate-binding protein